MSAPQKDDDDGLTKYRVVDSGNLVFVMLSELNANGFINSKHHAYIEP